MASSPRRAGQVRVYSVLSAEERNVAEWVAADGWPGRVDWRRADRNCLRWG